MLRLVTAPYQIVVLAADSAWAQEVECAVQDALESVLGRRDAVTVAASVPPRLDPAAPAPHTAVAFLADEASRDDSALLAELREARGQALPLVPIVRAESDVFAMLPAMLRPLNAIEWGDPPNAAVQALLRLLGIVEQDRKLFLSYRRSDTSPLALQLRRALAERSFDVFLDRFSVPPAADVQRRIDIELSDKAFVLLLESASATHSQWVQHEVAFSLAHRISLLALVLPETQAEDRHRAIPDQLRSWLDDADLDSADELTEAALARVLDEIELSYGAQLRRRRDDMLAALKEWLERAGADPEPADDAWALGGAWPPGERSVFLVTPRAPVPRDMHALDLLRRRRAASLGRDVGGVLAFGAPVRDADDAALIAWVSDGRPLRVEPLIGMKEVLSV